MIRKSAGVPLILQTIFIQIVSILWFQPTSRTGNVTGIWGWKGDEKEKKHLTAYPAWRILSSIGNNKFDSLLPSIESAKRKLQSTFS